jgi:hypothetical protein
MCVGVELGRNRVISSCFVAQLVKLFRGHCCTLDRISHSVA